MNECVSIKISNFSLNETLYLHKYIMTSMADNLLIQIFNLIKLRKYR